MKNHGRTPIPVSRSDSIGQRTRQNGVGSHIDAVSLEILALTSITERGYWGIELGGHTHTYNSKRAVSDGLIPSVTIPGTTGHDAGIIGHDQRNTQRALQVMEDSYAND